MSASQNHILPAAIWMSGAIISFSAMAVGGREMSTNLDTFEIMMYRSMIGAVLVIGFAKALGTLNQVSSARIGTHFMRNIAHFAGQNLWFFALTMIPFAQLFAFEFSVPIWVTLAAPFVLSERLTPLRVAAVFMGFVGILIVTRPWEAGLSAGIIAAALCAICFAATTIYTKQLTQTASVTCILFWLTTMQLVFGIICAGYDGDIALPTMANLPWVFVVGFGGLFAHLCITKALQLAPATIVTPIDFTRLPLIAMIGYVFYNEPLDIWVIMGAIIIFMANYINIWAETRRQRLA